MMDILRLKGGFCMSATRSFFIGKVPIGGGAPVSVQSMTNTDSRDAAATL